MKLSLRGNIIEKENVSLAMQQIVNNNKIWMSRWVNKKNSLMQNHLNPSLKILVWISVLFHHATIKTYNKIVNEGMLFTHACMMLNVCEFDAKIRMKRKP